MAVADEAPSLPRVPSGDARGWDLCARGTRGVRSADAGEAGACLALGVTILPATNELDTLPVFSTTGGDDGAELSAGLPAGACGILNFAGAVAGATAPVCSSEVDVVTG